MLTEVVPVGEAEVEVEAAVTILPEDDIDVFPGLLTSLEILARVEAVVPEDRIDVSPVLVVVVGFVTVRVGVVMVGVVMVGVTGAVLEVVVIIGILENEKLELHPLKKTLFSHARS